MKLPSHLAQQWVAEERRVLDLGCGDGTLLRQLMDERKATGYGIEINPERINACIAKGVNVLEKDLDKDLCSFSDNSFDTVLLTQTLQAVRKPDVLLDELLRIGSEGIVTFPNFGIWKARVGLAVGGKMPVSKELPHEWYDTPNIHFCTVKDFETLCEDKGITVLDRYFLNNTNKASWLSRTAPNLFAMTAFYRITKS